MAFKDQLTPEQIVELRAERHRMSQLTLTEQLECLEAQIDCLDRGEIWTPAKAEATYTNVTTSRTDQPDANNTLLTKEAVEEAIQKFKVISPGLLGGWRVGEVPIPWSGPSLAAMLSDPAPQEEDVADRPEPARQRERPLGGTRLVTLD